MLLLDLYLEGGLLYYMQQQKNTSVPLLSSNRAFPLHFTARFGSP